jgi:hypothetical protein
MGPGQYHSLAACTRFTGELPAYLEGEPNAFVASHARECAACGNLLADLQSLRATAHLLPQEEPSPAVWNSLRAVLAAEKTFVPADCLRFEDDLPAYLEGEANTFAAAHARACASCGALAADLQAISQAAHEFTGEEPPRAVWARVRATLEAEGAFADPRHGWGRRLAFRFLPAPVPLGALASLVLLAAALSFPSVNLRHQEGTGESLPLNVAQIAPALPAGELGSLAKVVSELESSFKANESTLEPGLRATYDKSLVSLNGSIQECLDLLQSEPKDPLVHDYLLTAYTRKAEVLSSALEFDGRWKEGHGVDEPDNAKHDQESLAPARGSASSSRDVGGGARTSRKEL